MPNTDIHSLINSINLEHSTRTLVNEPKDQEIRICNHCSKHIVFNQNGEGGMSVQVYARDRGGITTDNASKLTSIKASGSLPFICSFDEKSWRECGGKEALEKLFNTSVVREKG